MDQFEITRPVLCASGVRSLTLRIIPHGDQCAIPATTMDRMKIALCAVTSVQLYSYGAVGYVKIIPQRYPSE